jgi:hypothetical protein
MQKLILDAKRWARGERKDQDGPLQNLLLGKDGCLCCLGYWLATLGINGDTLFTEGTPEDVCSLIAEARRDRNDGDAIEPIPSYLATWDAEFGLWKDSLLSERLVAINDDTFIEDPERVAQMNEALRLGGEPLEVVLVETPEECEAAGGLSASFGKTAA